MKQLILLTSLSVLLFSCHFSKGVKKDLGTGLYAAYNGFAIQDVYLASGPDDARLSDNKVKLGDRVSIVVTGVGNYAEQGGKVFPACTIILKDKSGKELLNLPNAFADIEKAGQPIAEASTLKAILTTGNPMAAGETYRLEAHFYDLHQKESTINTNVDIVLQ